MQKWNGEHRTQFMQQKKNITAYLTVDQGYVNSHFLKKTKMVFFAEISSLDFAKNVVYTISIECLPAMFSQHLSLIKHI